MKVQHSVLREFSLSDQQFERLRALVKMHTGISLGDSKRELVYSRLSRRLRELRLSGFEEYIDQLERADDGEIEHFTNAITTNLTSFFRENHHFEFLADTALPMAAESNSSRRKLRIWSAGCSTGEEPYSIAMTIREAAPQLRGWDIKILATDLDSQVLSHAQRGQYRPDHLARLSPDRRRQWFSQHDANYSQIVPDVRDLVKFAQLNLLQSWPFRGPFDVIFCRNVVIYFDKPTQRSLFSRFADYQRIGDHLLIGHSESLHQICDRYQLVGKTTYRKIR